jgi:hypothetical protein
MIMMMILTHYSDKDTHFVLTAEMGQLIIQQGVWKVDAVTTIVAMALLMVYATPIKDV